MKKDPPKKILKKIPADDNPLLPFNIDYDVTCESNDLYKKGNNFFF